MEGLEQQFHTKRICIFLYARCFGFFFLFRFYRLIRYYFIFRSAFLFRVVNTRFYCFFL